MNNQWRSVVSQGVIIVGALVGAWMLLLAPMRQDLERAESHLDRARRESARAQSLAAELQGMRASLALSKAALVSAARRSASASDPAALFDVVSAIGKREGVTIHQMQPARSAAGAPGAVEGDASIAYEIEATGRYADVARFIGAVEQEAGFAAIEGVSLRPASGEPGQVRAQIRTRHHTFNVPSAERLAALAAASEGATP